MPNYQIKFHFQDFKISEQTIYSGPLSYQNIKKNSKKSSKITKNRQKIIKNNRQQKMSKNMITKCEMHHFPTQNIIKTLN